MTQIQFKTNINCGNCIKTVTPILNGMDEVDEWQVALESVDKILTVDGEHFTAEEVISKLNEVGFKATQL
ncbi:MAG: copper chaperone [Algoriphagus sp.]|jgi:copper chaperone